MKKITVPEGMKGPRENGQALAVGPFAMIHNGLRSLGFFLEDQGDVWVVSDGARDYVLDSSYTVKSNPSAIIFHSDIYGSGFLLRPLTQNDVSWLAPDESGIDVNDLKELYLDGATNQYSGD